MLLSAFYYTYDMLNMFRAPLCTSSGAHDYIPVFTTWKSASWVLMVVRCGLAGYVAGLVASHVVKSGI
jgi:hypothetical protein